MALPTITITNVSGGPLDFPQLNVLGLADTASATVSLWNFTFEIQNDADLSAALAAGDITATVSGEAITNPDTTLTAAQANVMLQPLNGIDILHNMDGAVAPTITDDEDAGYSIGSFWTDTVAQKLWSCYDATAGAAVWKSATETPGAIPETWAQTNVPASQAQTAMSANISMLFDTVQAIRGGSITGINARFFSALTGGSATATVTINGTPGTLSVTVTGTSARATQASGVDTYVAGDLIGIVLSTDAGFLPSGKNDVESWLEVQT